MQIEYQSDDNTIDVKTRAAGCEVKTFPVENQTFVKDTWYTFKLILNNGVASFDPNVGKGNGPVEIQDYSFAADEEELYSANMSYLKTGIYL